MSTSVSVLNRLCVIFNPTAKGDKARKVLRRLQALQTSCVLKPTLAAGAARTLATEAVRSGFETIVAVGGDGTIHEVLNGMADAPDGLARSRLAVVPMGTVNVFARELGLPLQFEPAWETIQRGRELLIDLPQIEYQTAQGPRRRCFAQMAGCGLDARAVELMDWELKKRIGQFAYVASGLKALREKTAPVRVSDGKRSVLGQLVLLGNGRFYGGPIPVFRNADLQDGLIDICVFPKVNWFVLLRYACAYVSSKVLHDGPEEHFQAERVTLESFAEGEVRGTGTTKLGSQPNVGQRATAATTPLELDGEHVGHLPATCTMRPGVLRVVVP
jgi:YegS/Rv2252/BmrU family lipid kinase